MISDYGINMIEPLAVLDHPTMDVIKDIADNRNSVYVKEGLGCGEGVVVKRYDFVNYEGKTVWGKVLNTVFTTNKKVLSNLQKDDSSVEDRILHRSVNPLLIDKEYHKLLEEKSVVSFRDLMESVWNCLLIEYLPDEIKKERFPVIDFRKMRDSVAIAIKEFRPDILTRDK
jgi:hypothetical protein